MALASPAPRGPGLQIPLANSIMYHSRLLLFPHVRERFVFIAEHIVISGFCQSGRCERPRGKKAGPRPPCPHKHFRVRKGLALPDALIE